MFNNKNKILLTIVIIAAISSILLFSFSYTNYKTTKRKYLKQAQVLIQNTQNNIENQVLIRLNNVEHIPEDIALFLEQCPTPIENQKDILYQFVYKNIYLSGIAIGFETKNNDGGDKMNLLYYYRENDSIIFSDEPLITDSLNDWYALPKHMNKPSWIEPYTDTLSDYGEPLVTQQMISYTLPYHKADKSFAGVVDVDVYLDFINSFIKKFQILQTGSVLLLSHQKNIIYSLDDNFTMMSLDSLSYYLNKDVYEQFSKKLDSTEQGIFENEFFFNYSKNIISFKHLQNGMILCIIFPYDELYKDYENHKERILITAVVGFLIILSLSIILYFFFVNKIIKYYYKNLEHTVLEQTAELREKNEELIVVQEEMQQLNDNLLFALQTTDDQKRQLEEIYIHLTDNINYARTIQQSILPDDRTISKYFKEYFIIFKPKDVVSGDFYYLNKVNEYLVFALGDCTGHGVTGAFMTILSISFLHQIIVDKNVNSASEVLESLRNYIKNTLNNFGVENQNGLDIAFCAFNTKTNQLLFSGAYLPIIIVRNKILLEYKPTRNPVGFYVVEKKYEQKIIEVEPNDMVFLFSDGYFDQFTDKQDAVLIKKGSKSFKKQLCEISDLPVSNQKDILEKQLSDWQGEKSQTDDITVWGIRWNLNSDIF